MTFIAILKDSFREAIDGFVIYVMLALAFLVILVAASMSFDPAPPDQAYSKMVDRFNIAFQNRGNSHDQVGIRIGSGLIQRTMPLPVEYSVSDVQRTDAGTGSGGSYKFRLRAESRDLPMNGKSKEKADKDKAKPPSRPKGADTDWFRYVVAAWAKPKLDEIEVKFDQNTGIPILSGSEKAKEKKEDEGEAAPGFGTIEVRIPAVTERDAKAVTDDQMIDFLKNQFALHAAIEDVTIRRITEGVNEPDYVFEVETRGGSSVRGWPHTTNLLFGAFSLPGTSTLGEVMFLLQDQVVNGIGAAVTLLISVILTAFFIPNLIRKGSLDLIVSKPISRWKLLLYKYIGGLTFIFLVSTITIGGVWLVLGIRSGYWNPEFLLSIPILTFSFAILYAVSTLVAILTRSAVAAILITALFMFFLWLVGFVKAIVDTDRAMSATSSQKADDSTMFPQRQRPEGVSEDEWKSRPWYERLDWTKAIVDGLNNGLPRYKDLDKLMTKLLSESLLTPGLIRASDRTEYPSWGSAIGVSLAFITVMLLLAYWRFATRDG